MELHLEAATRAIADAGLDKSAIDGVIARPPHSAQQDNYSAVLAGRLGLAADLHHRRRAERRVVGRR